MADMDYWLGRKYAILQQEADAGSTSAQAGATAAQSGAELTRAQAAGVRAQNAYIPQVTLANIAQTQANTNLIGEQARVIAPESQARIRQMGAETGYTDMQRRALYEDAVRQYRVSPDSLTGVTGARMPSLRDYGYVSPSVTRPRRLPGESQADYMDRTGWGL